MKAVLSLSRSNIFNSLLRIANASITSDINLCSAMSATQNSHRLFSYRQQQSDAALIFQDRCRMPVPCSVGIIVNESADVILRSGMMEEVSFKVYLDVVFRATLVVKA